MTHLGVWDCMPSEFSVGGLGSAVELKLGEMAECSEMNGTFCGSLDAENAVRNVDCAGLTHEVSEGSKVSICAMCVIF